MKIEKPNDIKINFIILILGLISIIIGAIGLSHQYQIRRFLTYSSINHLGFILIIYSLNNNSIMLYYIIIYNY